MVEGPQATVQAKWIQRNYKNKKLKSVLVVKGRYKKRPPKNLKEFMSSGSSSSRVLKDVIKKGKVIFLFFDDDWVVIVKFGMTAWFSQKEDQPDVIFDFENKKLFYKDLRQFGTLTFTQDPLLVVKELNKIAPDILDSSTKFELVKDRINLSSKGIDQILMDQKIFVSGIGNIIKSEVLYDAKINPKRAGKDLSLDEWKRVFQSSKKIAQKVLRNIEQNKDDFSGVIKIYEKENDPKGNKVERYQSRDGRTTYWVPQVQG
jgi:formamidopyrimidine-DNA glycosylase